MADHPDLVLRPRQAATTIPPHIVGNLEAIEVAATIAGLDYAYFYDAFKKIKFIDVLKCRSEKEYIAEARHESAKAKRHSAPLSGDEGAVARADEMVSEAEVRVGEAKEMLSKIVREKWDVELGGGND